VEEGEEREVEPAAPPEAPPPAARGAFPLEPSIKLLAFLATLCYVMGFLIVNSALVGLGVSELGTISPRLVFMGAIGLGFAAGVFVLPFMAAWIYQSTDSSGLKVLAIGMACLGFALIPALCIPLLHWTDNAFVGTQGRSWAISVLLSLGLAACSLAAACCAFRAWLHLAKPPTEGMPTGTKWLGRTLKAKDGAPQAPPWMGAGAWALLLLPALFLYVVGFGKYVYPTLPTQVGGGRPKQVHLIVGKDDVPALKALQMCSAHDGLTGCSRVSGTVGILFESNDAYLVRRLPEGSLGLITKDLVQATRVKANE
jgi:hypothetical protein